MGNHALKVPIPIKHDTIRTRFPARERLLAGQDGEFVEGRLVGETEAFVVLVLMGILVGALAGLQVAEALLDGGVDVGLAVAGGAAGVGASLAGLKDVQGVGEGGGGREGDDEEGFERE